MNSISYPRAYPKNDSHHVMQVPTISTKHITKEDGHAISCEGIEVLAAAEHCDLHIISFDNANDYHIEGPDDFKDDFPPELYSDDFRALIFTFASLGYGYLRLDADAEIIEGLPVFEW
jgi:hypothetical protein